jgi:phospholipid transport system substrate-binding protein
MARHRTISSILLLSLALSLPATAASDTAQSFVRERQSELTTLVKTNESKKIESVFDSILDYDALAQGSLRDHWATRSDAEKKEFQEVLKQLVQRTYRKNLDRTLGYDVRFDGESKTAESILVRTIAQNKQNAREEPLAIDYVVHRVGDTWRIRDIVTEGSSLVGNYNQQFNRIIKKDGFSELMKKMRNKLERG